MPVKATIGVISDTHGSLPQWVLDLFWRERVGAIIHAGDIVGQDVLRELSAIAPVTHVRGNMDSVEAGPGSAVYDGEYFSAYVLHTIFALDIDPAAAGVAVVIAGHTHVPEVEWKGGILYLNPGSPCHPRQGHPPSVALIQVKGDQIEAIICFED